MYDFFNNPPKTREDIREYITTWLEPCVSKDIYNLKNNESFESVSGFRRAFCIHTLWKNCATEEYAWTFSEKPEEINDESFMNNRVPDYNSAIEWFVEYFYKAWKLVD